MTLNINGNTSKLEEVITLLDKYKPSILLIQETNRSKLENKLFVNNYKIHQAHAYDGGHGLIFAIRRNSGLYMEIQEQEPDYII